MDRERFDALARLLATSGSRRGALGALLGVAFLGHSPEALAKRGKRTLQDRDHGSGQDRGRGHAGGHGQHHDRLAAEARGKRKNNKNRKRRKPRRDQDSDGGDGSSAGNCCGAKPCAPPEPGSTRSQCDFGGRSFAGQDLNGSTFRQIDGRGARFDEADLHGAVFAEACLQGATFRGANLEGSTWGNACLLDADFTDADLGGDSATFADAIRCRTTLPDGRRDDRDCDEDRPCCREQLGAGEACVVAGDCQNEPCQTKACVGGACVYTPVANGPSPNQRCATRCCSGTCCPSDATACNLEDLCCVPDCAGRDCGPDGCGRQGTCGVCPSGAVCEESSGQCLCTAQSCPNGCCAANGRCQPGESSQFCGAGGEPCASCTGQERCVAGACTCQPACQGKVCGPDGCGGSCGACPQHASCNASGAACTCVDVRCAGVCCAPGQVCDQEACCTPQPLATTCPEDTCGEVTNNCGQRVDCGACEPIICFTGTCHDDDHRCTYALDPSGQPGALCPAPRECCAALCCPAHQVCDERGIVGLCCTPEPRATTCAGGACGEVANNCGRLVDCGACPPVVCQTGTCSAADHRCTYVTNPNLTPCSSDTVTAGVCCDGQCVPGDCCANADCTVVGNACTEHTCTCGGGPACNRATEQCCGASPGGTCVNVDSSPATCGGCDSVCPAGGVCKLTVCTHGVCGTPPAPDNTNPGGACPGSEVCCAGACTDRSTDPSHCGMCETQCHGGSCVEPICISGVCGTQLVPNGQPGPGCGGQCCDGVCCTNPNPVCNSDSSSGPGECIPCPFDGTCTTGQVCCGGLCLVGTCCPLGAPCSESVCCRGDCPDGEDSHCCLFDLEECTSNSDCCSGLCAHANNRSECQSFQSQP